MRLRDEVAFDAPVSVSDGHGGSVEDWQEQFSARAGIRYLRGGETVQAGRLRGQQAVVITVHNAPETQAVTAAWRVRDTVRGIVYNVRTNPVPTEDHRFLEITAESGVEV